MAGRACLMSKKRSVGGFWSELCPDLLTAIFTLLGTIDRLAFRGVCKAWRATAFAMAGEKVKGLWLMYKAKKYYNQQEPKFIYNFVDCSCSTRPSKRPSYARSLPSLEGCSFLTAKHGWLLVGRFMVHGVVNVFFYDPFSGTTIKLPTLKISPWFYVSAFGKNRLEAKFDFTSSPTSLECMVVANFFHEKPGWLYTTTCRRGQSAWAPLAKFQDFKSVWLPPSLMVFHEGSFFCVCSRNRVGKVLAFHPETNTVRSLSGHPRQVEEARHYTCPYKKILCDLLEPSVAGDLVQRLGGEELLRSHRPSQEPLKRYRLPVIKEWGEMQKVVNLGEVGIGYPFSYQPFLQMEEGQLLLFYYSPHHCMENKVWINRRLVQPGQQDDLRWISSKPKTT